MPVTHAFSDSVSCFLADEDATLAAGQALAAGLSTPLVFWLDGDLGAGKTTLARGLLRGLGHRGAVKSPTYTLVESYRLPDSHIEIHHFDLYRFRHEDEWEDAGLDEFFHSGSLCLIEWPQQGGSHVPPPDILICLAMTGSGRKMLAHARSPNGIRHLQQTDLSIWQN